MPVNVHNDDGLYRISYSCISPGRDARTLLKRSLNARERGPTFDNARHREQKWDKIENTSVVIAEHRWSRRCYSVGLTVASDDARVDRAAFCAFGRWLGGGLIKVGLAAYCFWLQSWTDRFVVLIDFLLLVAIWGGFDSAAGVHQS